MRESILQNMVVRIAQPNDPQRLANAAHANAQQAGVALPLGFPPAVPLPAPALGPVLPAPGLPAGPGHGLLAGGPPAAVDPLNAMHELTALSSRVRARLRAGSDATPDRATKRRYREMNEEAQSTISILTSFAASEETTAGYNIIRNLGRTFSHDDHTPDRVIKVNRMVEGLRTIQDANAP
jgi:hypothetical protein